MTASPPACLLESTQFGFLGTDEFAIKQFCLSGTRGRHS